MPAPMTMTSGSEAMDVTRERLDLIERRAGKDAVAEIEDVSRAARGAPQNVVRRRQHPIGRAEQRHGIEVSLDRAVVADPVPGLVERRAPVHSDYVPPRGLHVPPDRAGVDAEVD